MPEKKAYAPFAQTSRPYQFCFFFFTIPSSFVVIDALAYEDAATRFPPLIFLFVIFKTAFRWCSLYSNFFFLTKIERRALIPLFRRQLFNV